MNLIEFLNKENINYNNLNIYRKAFTHTSYINEHKNEKEGNERLEFLGDAVLSLVIAEYLYKKLKLNEGEMSKLRSVVVCESTLANIARKIKIIDILRLGNGQDGDRPSILEDALEAFIAAIYLDLGYKSAKKFILKNFKNIIKKNLNKDTLTDSKSYLQELIKGRKTIKYTVINEKGEPHNREYTVTVQIEGKTIATGKGFSKKKAEKEAARLAIIKLENKK